MQEKQPAVYILSNKRHGTLYIGVTSNLIQRIWQHREGLAEGFAQRYGLKMLVWFELCDEMNAAIAREKQLKEWRCDWKIRLIEEANPDWQDLWPQIIGQTVLQK